MYEFNITTNIRQLESQSELHASRFLAAILRPITNLIHYTFEVSLIILQQKVRAMSKLQDRHEYGACPTDT